MTNPSNPFGSLMNPLNTNPPGVLTEQQVRMAVPAHLRSSVTQQLVDNINNIASDPLVAENIRDNFLSYSKILAEGKFKTEDYVNAVAYVSYKLMGYTNEDAYARTFVKRYTDLVAAGKSKKDISSYVAAYAKGKLVNMIMEQTMVPTYVLNQDIYQEAINKQAQLMRTAVSEKVQTDAANSILNHLKKPENIMNNLNINLEESSGMKEMRDALIDLAARQKEAIDNGNMKTIDATSHRLIPREEK